MLDFTVELTSEEVALLTLFENLDYSGFGTRLGRKEKVEPFRMMILLIHGAMNNRTSSRDLEKHVERDLFMKAVFGPDVHLERKWCSRTERRSRAGPAGTHSSGRLPRRRTWRNVLPGSEVC